MKRLILRFLLTINWIFFGGIAAIVFFVANGQEFFGFVAIGMAVGLTLALCWIFED